MRKKTILYIFLIFLINNGQLLGCTEIYVGNKTAGYGEARTLDFPINPGNNTYTGFPQMLNTTRIVSLDKKPLPRNFKLKSWRNIYGYFGRTGWESKSIIDGINTQGLSVSVLELDGSKYFLPGYGNTGKFNLSVYDVPNYILSQAKNIYEAQKLLEFVNVVQSAAKFDQTNYINIGVHFAISDSNGGHLIVQYTSNGTPTFHTNYTALSNNILDSTPTVLPDKNSCFMSSPILNYPASIPPDDSVVRLFKARAMINCVNTPESHNQVMYNAKSIISSLVIPLNTLWGTETAWASIKDLSNNVIYYQDYMQPGEAPFSSSPSPDTFFDISNLMKIKTYDLNEMKLNIPQPNTSGLEKFDNNLLPYIIIHTL